MNCVFEPSQSVIDFCNEREMNGEDGFAEEAPYEDIEQRTSIFLNRTDVEYFKAFAKEIEKIYPAESIIPREIETNEGEKIGHFRRLYGQEVLELENLFVEILLGDFDDVETEDDDVYQILLVTVATSVFDINLLREDYDLGTFAFDA